MKTYCFTERFDSRAVHIQIYTYTVGFFYIDNKYVVLLLLSFTPPSLRHVVESIDQIYIWLPRDRDRPHMYYLTN